MSSINQHSLSLASGLSRLLELNQAATARVSSGERIDRPSVDIAGVGKAAKLDAQQSRLGAVQVNLQNGVSRMQITSSQLGQIGRIVSRLGELATYSGSPVQNTADKALYQTEFTQLQNQLRQMIGGTTAEIGGTADAGSPSGSFNGSSLFGSSAGETLSVGLNSEDQLTLPVLNFRTGALGDLIKQDATGAYTTNLSSTGLLAGLDAALQQTTVASAEVGSVQSRLDFSASVIMTAKTNNEAALSVIRDADVAADSTTIARLQILTDSRNAMLAQARDSRASLIGLLTKK
jgi:flagellin